jgi:hypothetical protein
MQVTMEVLCDALEVMVIEQSVDTGFAITHFGRIDGIRTIAISTCHGDGVSYIIQ